MLKKVLLIIISLVLPMVLMADELTLNNDAPKSYVVKKGDTLWDISGIFLKQPWLWPKLWRINPEINNPHLIYPGDELNLVFDEQGQPMLVKEAPIEEIIKSKPELKWSPKVRTQLKALSPISTIPLDVIAPYIRYDTVFSNEEIEVLPYVLGSEEGYKSSVDGFKTYVKGNLDAGKGYAIYQKGEEIIDPETQESLGFYGRLVGSGKSLRAGNIENNEPATLYVEGAKQEIRSGNIVIPVNEDQLYPSFFTMQAANSDVQASIIKTVSGVREFGKLEVVVINRGSQHAILQGDVLSVKRKSPGVIETGNGPVYTSDASLWNRMANSDDSDYNMPIETVGNMMVFKVYEKVSMALVLHSEKPLRLKDLVTAP